MEIDRQLTVTFPPRRVLTEITHDRLPSELDVIEARLRRAAQHIDELDREVTEWSEANNVTVVHRSDATFTRHEWVVQVPPAPFDDWGVLVGEVFYALRGSLDNAVYRAAQLVTGLDDPPKPRELAFPIALTPESFRKNARMSLRVFRDAGRFDIVEAIEQLQPYHDGQGAILPEDKAAVQGLGLLKDLNDRDKHRIPHQVTLAAPASSPTYQVPHAGVVEHTAVLGKIADGAVVGSLILDSPDTPTMTLTHPFVVSALGLPLYAPSMLQAHLEITTEALHAFAYTVWPST